MDRFKKIMIILVTGLYFLMPGAALAVSVYSDFNTSTEAWTVNEGGIATYQEKGGNPDGFVRVDDNSTVIAFGLFAPEKFLGDLTIFDGGILSFDSIILESGLGDFGSSFASVIIERDEKSAKYLFDYNGDMIHNWTGYSVPFTAEVWGVTQAEWDNLLSDVTRIQVNLEVASGHDAVGLDNFKLENQPVPEPGTIILLGSGLLALVGFNRRRLLKIW